MGETYPELPISPEGKLRLWLEKLRTRETIVWTRIATDKKADQPKEEN